VKVGHLDVLLVYVLLCLVALGLRFMTLLVYLVTDGITSRREANWTSQHALMNENMMMGDDIPVANRSTGLTAMLGNLLVGLVGSLAGLGLGLLAALVEGRLDSVNGSTGRVRKVVDDSRHLEYWLWGVCWLLDRC